MDYAKSIRRLLFILFSLFFFLYSGVVDAALVSKTADTAVAAKNMALAAARRSAFVDMVGPNVSISDKELVGLVESESIENEKVSATSYAADVVIELDKAAVNNWLMQNNMQTIYQAPVVGGDRVGVMFEYIGGLRDWVTAARAVRDAGADLRIGSISDKGIFATISVRNRAAFVAAIRNVGANVYDFDGVITIR